MVSNAGSGGATAAKAGDYLSVDLNVALKSSSACSAIALLHPTVDRQRAIASSRSSLVAKFFFLKALASS